MKMIIFTFDFLYNWIIVLQFSRLFWIPQNELFYAIKVAQPTVNTGG